MGHKIRIREIWVKSVEIMVKKPVILLPFFIVAFLEGLALELIYFSTRKPFSFIAAPIIRKLSGPAYLHYPFNLLKLHRYFYYAQMLIYVIIGVFLTAISVNILKNIKAGLTLKTNALIRNAASRYFSFAAFGIILAILIYLLGRADTYVFSKFARFIIKYLPNLPPNITSLGAAIFFFLTNTIMYTFFVLTIPIIVIRKNSLLKALLSSIGMGFRHFFGIFTLIFAPLFLYLPITLLKGYSLNLMPKTFPEITLFILSLGIVISVFIDCFIFVCAAQFVLTVDGDRLTVDGKT